MLQVNKHPQTPTTDAQIAKGIVATATPWTACSAWSARLVDVIAVHYARHVL